jgi:hypothetical protein
VAGAIAYAAMALLADLVRRICLRRSVFRSASYSPGWIRRDE